MFNCIKCLLIGYGNIGKIHSKYLNANQNVLWFWYDPFIVNYNGPFDYNRIHSINKLDDFDKIFILTPEYTHYTVYKHVRENFNGDIFVEKPAIIKYSEFNMLDDARLTVGLVERFNPAVEVLKKHINIQNIINIDFSRCCASNTCSNVSILEDIGIHDLDLCLYFTELEDIQSIKNPLLTRKNNTTILQINSNVISRFIWSKDTFYKERKIIVRQTDCTFVADLQEQTVVKYLNCSSNQQTTESLFVEKGSSIYNEQQSFLSSNPKYITAKKSHELLLRLLKL